MTYHWSSNAAFIQSVYRAWSPDYACSEAEILASESALGLDFPTMLRQFYRTWGRNSKMTGAREYLLGPGSVLVKSDALLFCRENQGVGYWAIPTNGLRDDDPSVYFGYAPESMQTGEIERWHLWYQLSIFLDALTLGHAFAGGAAHGGVSVERLEEQRRLLLVEHWPIVQIHSAPWGVFPGADTDWVVYGVAGQAIDVGFDGHLWCVARSMDGLEEVRKVLDLTWHREW